MKHLCASLLLCVFGYIIVSAQQSFSVSGTVFDSKTNTPLPDVVVTVDKLYTVTDTKGNFEIEQVPVGHYTLKTVLMGYEQHIEELDITNNDIEVIISIGEATTTLDAVTVKGKSNDKKARELTSVTVEISEGYLRDNRENSLMQSLKKLPGISAMSIGSGQSKPSIRGLGFNRVAVVQNSIKHEAQQWGSDHGLEIDQYDVNSIQIVKGPASLRYGSDAIGGVLNIRPEGIPEEHALNGTVNLLAESNNDLLGVSTGIQGHIGKKWYYRNRLTFRDYADYKVPADDITYENYVFSLHDNNLRNTAGTEANASMTIGYIGEAIKSETYISNVYAKNGFFANAHGLEVRTSNIDYDASARDVDLPYHKVNHFKATNNTSFYGEGYTLRFNLGFQNNLRDEHTEPVGHGYMPTPDGTVDRSFEKNTITAEVVGEMTWENHDLETGITVENQHNQIAGWGFLIPEYKRFTIGAFAFDKYELNDNTFLSAGIRYDFGRVNTSDYFDWYPSEVTGEDGTVSEEYLQRAYRATLDFSNFSAATGLSFLNGNTTYKINVGKSFRIPLANELASNGVNYHMYRYEKGNMELKAEESYQIDTEISYKNKRFDVSVTPFANYFDNYIYLNPIPEYYETQQVYEYSQTKVFRAGGELSVGVKPVEPLRLNASVEYVHSRQLSGSKKGFSLPFSPPLSSVVSATYQAKDLGFFKRPQFVAGFRATAKQAEIVPPEEVTDGYNVLDLSVLGHLNLFSKDNPARLRLKLNNVFNTKYFDHTSFYRMIDVPEPGRNFSASLTVPF